MDHNLLANGPASPSTNLGTLGGIGPLGNFNLNIGSATGLFAKILSLAIGIMTIVGIIWFLFVLFTGAVGWLGSGGDKQRLQNSQKQITNGLIGLILVIVAIFFVKLIGIIFGIEDILSLEFITSIWSPGQ